MGDPIQFSFQKFKLPLPISQEELLVTAGIRFFIPLQIEEEI